jgi:hypothetical protein
LTTAQRPRRGSLPTASATNLALGSKLMPLMNPVCAGGRTGRQH